MKIADAVVMASCWCDRTEVEIPVSWIREGLTGSCSEGCGPGCTMVAPAGAEEDPYDDADVVPTEQRKWKMNKFVPARYDPADDSTPGLPRRAEVSLLVGDGLCACGCGEAPAGRNAKFLMGHDAKLKGKLTRAHAAHISVALIAEDGTATVIDALDYADRFSTSKVDWRKLVTDATAKIMKRRGPIDKRAAERTVVERAAKDGAIRVGRWDATGGAAAIYSHPDGGYEVEYVDEVGRIRQTRVDVA